MVEESMRLETALGLLDEIEDYFDQRQDADCDQDGFIPNKEMQMMNVVSDLRATLRALPASPVDGEGELRKALDVRDLYINPDLLEQAADEIDCGPGCIAVYTETDVNFSMCVKADAGEYCPNDIAETLRAVAKVARAALNRKDSEK